MEATTGGGSTVGTGGESPPPTGQGRKKAEVKRGRGAGFDKCEKVPSAACSISSQNFDIVSHRELSNILGLVRVGSFSAAAEAPPPGMR